MDTSQKPSVIEFITITTGGTTMNSRAGSEDTLVNEVARLLRPRDQLTKGGKMIRVPGGYGLKTTSSPGAWAYTLYREEIPVTTCIVCWEAGASEGAWEVAINKAPDGVVVRRPRGVPWLSATIEVTALMAFKDTLELIGIAQLELAIAWAIIERETA